MSVRFIILVLLSFSNVRADEDSSFDKFRVLIQTLEENLVDYDEKNIEKLAIEGLIHKLEGKVFSAKDSSSIKSIRKAEKLDESFLHLQFHQINPHSMDEVTKWIASSQSEGDELDGIILDLRFAKGFHHDSAISFLGLFLNPNEPIYSTNAEIIHTKNTENTFSFPIAILINNQTEGTSELVAASLQEKNRGLVFGSASLGMTFHMKQVPTSFNNEDLYIASGKIKMSNGDVLTKNGINPDIAVEVSNKLEKIYFENPYYQVQASQQKFALNESDLVKLKEREIAKAAGDIHNSSNLKLSSNNTSNQPLVLSDPVLARGLDFLKGVRLMRNLKKK